MSVHELGLAINRMRSIFDDYDNQIINLSLEIQALESKLAKAVEALRVINSYPETLVFADVFAVARKTLEEIGEQE